MKDKEIITIVTGLPRSGTSLMMQILNKSELDIFTDGIRQKDISNPEGYFELEAVKGIVRDNSFLKNAFGKVVKIVAPLPIYLDKSLNYRVIFMRREMDEVLKSQEKMLNKDQVSEREKFRTIYELHLKKTYSFFYTNNITFIDIQHKALLYDSENEVMKIKEFLNLKSPVQDLVCVIKLELHRNKLS
jgi:hypothetical protein